MIPYYSPNFGPGALLRSLFVFSPGKKLVRQFRELTGKKHILVTNSCRSALYLAYQAAGRKGEVITSPMTCKVAIDPIIASGNKPVYSDIQPDNLLIDPDQVSEKVNPNTIALQIIHLGGFCCDVQKLAKIARQHQLMIIEDCAQGLFASYKGKMSGTTGDVVCFSLIKNAYGIGGGILATDDEQLFNNAQSLQRDLPAPSTTLMLFRVIRNLLETYRYLSFGEKLYKKFMDVRGRVKPDTTNPGILEELKLRRPSALELRIGAVQVSRAWKLNNKRKTRGKELMRALRENNLNRLYPEQPGFDASFVKFYLYNEFLDSQQHIPLLNEQGVEAKHLEHTFDNRVQERLASRREVEELNLRHYDKIHDRLISLPLTESRDHARSIVKKLSELIP